MAFGTLAAILGSIAVAGAGIGAGVGLSKAAGAGKSAGQPAATPLPMPEAPKPEAAIEKAQETVKRKRAMATQTVYTSPLGIAGEAQVARKTLLGQ